MRKIDLTGKVFGNLTVLRESGVDKHGSVVWECKCTCGNLAETRGYCLTNGTTASCGCLKGAQLTGQRFGRLLVENFVTSHKGRIHFNKYWNCKCDCGASTLVPTNKLKTGHTKSCGCLRRSVDAPDEKTGFIRVYRRYKSTKRTFSLSEDQFKHLVQQNCYYCGESPRMISKGRKGSPDFVYNGLDRLDNSLGYTIDNVVPCCKRDNKLKSNLFSPEETKVMVAALESFRLEKANTT